MTPDMEPLRSQISTLRKDIADLEGQIPTWNADNLAGAKQPRLIARRIVQSAQRLETLVKENTFSPGT
jgi:hypothetical protein